MSLGREASNFNSARLTARGHEVDSWGARKAHDDERRRRGYRWEIYLLRSGGDGPELGNHFEGAFLGEHRVSLH